MFGIGTRIDQGQPRFFFEPRSHLVETLYAEEVVIGLVDKKVCLWTPVYIQGQNLFRCNQINKLPERQKIRIRLIPEMSM